jgi:formylglycine-generating enzyme required for sulfatase activity
MEFVLIKPGKFVMGSNIHFGDNDESPERTVSITRPFYLGKYEVTQRQWKAVMDCNPSRFKGRDRPVETVSWNDALEFLSRLELLTGMNVALPTEARWEYACRAGAAGPWSFGNSEDEIDDYAWHGMNSGDSTKEVGLKLPNAWGLYDMHGNVGEWCADGYARYPASAGDETDTVQPPGPGRSPVWRGGAWGDNPYMLRSAYRNASGVDDKHHGIGLRCMILIGEDAS